MSMIGKTLAHYEITSQLGKGGMGEVYQAKDRKLGRDVAIKVLPEEFAKDADRVARFQREAKMLASLNHPNIAAIYGLEESGGTNFLVLELIEGETLADRLKHGAIPAEESLKFALQIAEALEAAHDKGVIHRDLKPANIKVTPEGKVKVLDFGLAKAYAETQEANLSNSPTLSDAATRQGVILGTAAYMSPEQARGKSVDKRADVWAFGCVLYEMLTGQAAFQGEDVTEILAAVVKGGANLSLLPVNLHPRIQEAITRCLQKDLGRRYRDISEAKYEIGQVLADHGGVFVLPVAAIKPKRRLRLSIPWAAALATLCLIAGGAVIWNLKPTETPQIMRFYYDLPEGQRFSSINLSLLAVSSDGKQFIYSSSEGLYLRSMSEYQAKLISGTEPNPSTPFFSLDGKWVGYWSSADGKLKKIAIGGGAPVVLCDANILLGASWGADDTIVYGEVGKGIMRVSANGGTPELIVKLTGIYAVRPQILPGGKAVLYALVTAEKSQVMVQSLESGEQKVLIEGDSPQYLPTGHLVYMVGNNLYSVPMDSDSLKIKGGPVSLIGNIFRVGHDNAPQFAVSNSGVLIYMPGAAGAIASAQRTLAWVNHKGIEEPIAANPNSYYWPKVSPDGTRLALSIDTNGNSDIWIYDLNRETPTRLTFDEGNEFAPLWTRDGKGIVYVSGNVAKSAVYRKAADGTGKEVGISPPQDRLLIPCSWSVDGKTLIAMGLHISKGLSVDIASLSMDNKNEWKALLREKYLQLQPAISPDGRWIAYSSTESGIQEIYVRPFPEIDAGKWQVSAKGGNSPLWSPDGREIFYRSSDAVIAVSIETTPTFKPGKPEILFHSLYIPFSTSDFQPWDISPDGKRFLMMKAQGSDTSVAGSPRKINIVLNWFEELKQRVPVD